MSRITLLKIWTLWHADVRTNRIRQHQRMRILRRQSHLVMVLGVWERKKELSVKKSQKIWILQKKSISLHRESVKTGSRCFLWLDGGIGRHACLKSRSSGEGSSPSLATKYPCGGKVDTLGPEPSAARRCGFDSHSFHNINDYTTSDAGQPRNGRAHSGDHRTNT